MKKIYTILTALFTATCVYADSTNNRLDYASTKDIRDINPHLYAGEMAAQNMVFEPLVINTNQGIRPFLAESWRISEDGKSYLFNLRKDVKFTDGEPFNAFVAKMNIEAVLANFNRHAWLELVRQIDSVRAPDEFTLELTLKNPYYPTLTELALTRPFRFLSPKCFNQGKTSQGVMCYAGTGPWILKEHKKNALADFSRNDNYWGELPKLNGVTWHVIPERQTMLLALLKGDIQLIFGADGDMLDMDSFKQISESGQFISAMSEANASRAIVLNSARTITSDQKVRQALQHAVDKAAIAKGVFNDTESIAETLMAKNVPYADVDVQTYPFNLLKAAQLLEEAGWNLSVGKNIREKAGKPLSLLLSYNINNAAEKEIAQLLQADFRKIGVDLQILGEEKQAYLDRQKNGDFDLQYSLSWGRPYDPASFVSSFRIPAHADYQGQKGLPNKTEIDEMIGELLITPDEQTRIKLYQKLFKTLAEQAVYVPLTYSKTKAIYSAQLEGVGFNPSQYEIPFEKMSFKK
ncbi:nickel ABC transporter substrate-binding protein [Basfia succiniciproducens]|uniref:Nickel transport system substrate-binding protein n=1 Tax=Basfia succiniciproducens TaxID=653940 RepID=A0A1G5DES7_9PAST|nr:nickel ABC transporter substrate-binding protein [Basfia succiniciproducens]QIM67933.1 nickel ABC transporter, nickel/metallophore periplasmic binding protein [Basfia succiniciproducens]SCY13243.1 nickel transport system substrate-binding protein [Basfia succiniciproducens]